MNTIVNEQWRSISRYINYQVSNIGRVRNANTGKMLRNQINTHGYHYITLTQDGKRNNHLIHRLVAGEFIDNYDNKKYVDHIDRNINNNIIDNLRWVTGSENQMNKTKSTSCAGRYKGVHFDSNRGKYRARIEKDGVKYNVGSFMTEKDAARAYNVKALELFGEFGCLNDV